MGNNGWNSTIGFDVLSAVTLSSLAIFFANSISPFFLLLFLCERQGLRRAVRFWLQALLSLVVAVGLAELGKKFQVLPGESGFPSGHTTFASTCAAALVLHRGLLWLAPGLLLTLIMMASLVYAGWHSILDTVGAFVLGPVITLLVWRLGEALANRRKPSISAEPSTE